MSESKARFFTRKAAPVRQDSRETRRMNDETSPGSVNTSFETKIFGKTTTVALEIRPDYTTRASFCAFDGQEYVFEVFASVAEVDEFMNLAMPRYGFDATTPLAPEHRQNMLADATGHVFTCVEEIAREYGTHLMRYGLHHLKKRSVDTYEHYVHHVACRCIVHSDYFASTIPYPAVEFYDSKIKFND